MVTIKNAYSCREEIKAAGGKFNGSEWVLTNEQLASLVEKAVASFVRSNKRDRAFGVAFADVLIVHDGDSVSGKLVMDPFLEEHSLAVAAQQAKYQ